MILLIMIFLHIVDDYYLQGVLAKLKQKKWWKENNSNELYKNDYLVGLFMHSFSWTFMVMLPIFYVNDFKLSLGLLTTFIINLICHAYVDHLKANKGTINLIEDQAIHILQIVTIYIGWIIL